MIEDQQRQNQTTDDRWHEVAAVEREIRLLAYASAGDPARIDDMKIYAIWAGRLQRAIEGQTDA